MNNMKHKILMTLVLLMTVASGAWAKEVTIGDPTSTSTDPYLPSYSLYNYSFTQQIYTADEIGMSGTITTLTMWLKNTSSYARNFNVYMKEVSGSIFETNNSWVSLSADDLVGTATINNSVENPTETTITLVTPFEYSGTGNLLICIHDIRGRWSSGLGGVFFETGSNQALYAYRDGSAYDISNPGVNGTLIKKKNVVRLDIEESGLEVTTNKAEGETTFTWATFAMPAFDATAEYELVRDMKVGVNAVMADRVRIQKDNNVFVPVTASEMLPTVTDGIDEQNPAAMTSATDYTLQLQKEGENNSWTDVTELSVGTFRYVVTGVGLYDGVMYTNTFELFQGYEIDVPAGEYVTYYKDEALKVEDENAKLYTITAVSGTTATATELTVAPANTPLLVKNNAAEKKTILLIPTTTDTPDNVEVYSGFKGTLEATTIAASTDEQNNYALNGKQFVWVKDALAVDANKAWLSISSQQTSGAPTINLVFGETTKITTTNLTNLTNGDWYDLNGRKLNGMPTKKGIYMNNGRKVVVK